MHRRYQCTILYIMMYKILPTKVGLSAVVKTECGLPRNKEGKSKMPRRRFRTLLAEFIAGVSLGAVALGSASAQTARPLTGLAPEHVTISVEDIDREAEWYVRVLGFTLTPPTDTNPDFRVHHLTMPGYRVDLVKYKGSSRSQPSHPLYLQQGWIHVAFSVPDLGAAMSQLKALNTDVTSDNNDAKGNPTRLVVHDPEGNELEFFKR